jgi:hypothetical protein
MFPFLIKLFFTSIGGSDDVWRGARAFVAVCDCLCLSATDDIDEAAFNATFEALHPLEATTAYSLFTYDAVWSAAIGIAAATAAGAAGANGSEAVVRGSDVMAIMAAGEFPEFEGAAGWRAFLRNGDWDLSHSFIEISNFGTPRGADQPRHAVVATVDLASYELSFVEGEAIVWANGKEYPYVSPSPL